MTDATRRLGEQVLESLSSGLIAVNRQRQIVAVNRSAAHHLAVAPSRLAEGMVIDAIESAEFFGALFDEVKCGGGPLVRREIALVSPQGVRKEIGISAAPLEGPEAFNGVIFLFTDITERRNLERAAELNRQLAALGELTAGVVHELRSPVSAISGLAEIMMRKLPQDEDLHEAAKTIFEEAANLERSIARFLGFARPFDLEPSFCNAEEIVDRVIKLSERRAAGKQVMLTTHLAEDLPGLRADSSRVAQALANIVNNAIDAVDIEGQVTVSVRCIADMMIFEVCDNGPGIHLAPGEDLFTPFFTKKEAGTGLGLPIAHRIVTAHGGTIGFQNLPEAGALFQVKLPLSSGFSP